MMMFGDRLSRGAGLRPWMRSETALDEMNGNTTVPVEE